LFIIRRILVQLTSCGVRRGDDGSRGSGIVPRRVFSKNRCARDCQGKASLRRVMQGPAPRTRTLEAHLPAVHDDATCVAAVLVIRPPHPALDGHAVVRGGSTLQWMQRQTRGAVRVSVSRSVSGSVVWTALPPRTRLAVCMLGCTRALLGCSSTPRQPASCHSSHTASHSTTHPRIEVICKVVEPLHVCGVGHGRPGLTHKHWVLVAGASNAVPRGLQVAKRGRALAVQVVAQEGVAGDGGRVDVGREDDALLSSVQKGRAQQQKEEANKGSQQPAGARMWRGCQDA
jgi:hypothetical protein